MPTGECPVCTGPPLFVSLSIPVALIFERGRIKGTETLAACDFPSACRAASYLSHEERNDGGGEEEKEKRQPEIPHRHRDGKRSGQQDQAHFQRAHHKPIFRTYQVNTLSRRAISLTAKAGRASAAVPSSRVRSLPSSSRA